MKAINKPKDLERVKLLDNIKLTYYSKPANNEPVNKDEKWVALGIYGGSFELQDKKYIIFSKTKKSGFFSTKSLLTSSLYQIQDDSIVESMNAIHGYYDVDVGNTKKPATKDTPTHATKNTKNTINLESAIKNHAEVFYQSRQRDERRNKQQETQKTKQ